MLLDVFGRHQRSSFDPACEKGGTQRLRAAVRAARADWDFARLGARDRARGGRQRARKTPVYALPMAHRDAFWKLEPLSDAQLLESLSSVLRTQHRTLAALVAHLAEVEERRLHLEAAYSSMFAHCVGRLGMSEDEAVRRHKPAGGSR